jgi:uncharacterized protein (DUF885 family)
MYRLNIILLLLFMGCGKTEDFSVHDKLIRIIDENHAFITKEFPSIEDSVYDRLPGMKEEDILRRVEFARATLENLNAINEEQISSEDQITLKLILFIQENIIESYNFNTHLNSLLSDGGFHTGFAFLPGSYEFLSVEDYENYIKILNAFPQYTRENIALLKKGLESGICQPKIIFKGYEITFDSHIVENPEESIFYAPFTQFPDNISREDQERLQETGGKAVMEGAVEGFRLFSEFMKQDYMINTRTTIGASDLPDGADYYQQRIKYYTTLELSPDSIHRLGLHEVARIQLEMEEIINEVGFEGDFTEFLAFLRTDPQFYAKTPDELLKAASFIVKKMDGKLPALVGKLPRQPYTVNPVPDHLAPKYTTGRYIGAPRKSTKSGQYWVNTYALETRTLYTLEALSLHEAVPGHHLQHALTAELDHLPKFRQNLYLSAFGEGWGLYSEYLGREAGFYTDPYSNFGRLTYEMWRACRLVVDTGIHAKGWTRQQAMDYMAAHTALSLHEIRTETDRYISWPAQALSYKIGELKIRELRKRTEEALGKDFDIREFHDLVLSQGTVTLTILEEMVEKFIKEKS